MRRGAVIMTFLAGLIVLSAATPARTETRRALETEARQHGAPMVWIWGVYDGEPRQDVQDPTVA